jgi:hypothetical protein
MTITKSFILVFAVAALLAAIPGHAAEQNTFDGDLELVPVTFTPPPPPHRDGQYSSPTWYGIRLVYEGKR